MQRLGMMTRVIAVALGVVIAIAALASADAQQEPPHRFYGTGATAGDVISVARRGRQRARLDDRRR